MAAAKYLPGYFEVTIHTDLDLNSLAELPKDVQGLYYHEYLHFLQNLTTTYGILKTWNIYDRIRQLIHSVQNSNEKISLPLKNEVVSEQLEFFKFLQRLEGSSQITDPIAGPGYTIDTIEWEEDPFMARILPTVNAKHPVLTLKQNGFRDEEYKFGETAISESMVFLAESKFYPELNIPHTYPYKVAYMVANFLYSPIANNPEYLFSLCDTALMHPLPGWAFCEILTEMQKNKFTPVSGESIIDFGRVEYAKRGWNIDKQMELGVTALGHILDDIYNHVYFHDTKIWLKEIIRRGLEMRENNRFLMLEIFKSQTALGGALIPIWQYLGGPHCINAVNKRSMRNPFGMENLKIQPQHFKVSGQINLLLLTGAKDCKLYSICSASENKELVDERCHNNPWSRVNDEFGCPFAAAWALYDFPNKEIELNGRNLIDIN